LFKKQFEEVVGGEGGEGEEAVVEGGVKRKIFSFSIKAKTDLR